MKDRGIASGEAYSAAPSVGPNRSQPFYNCLSVVTTYLLDAAKAAEPQEIEAVPCPFPVRNKSEGTLASLQPRRSRGTWSFGGADGEGSPQVEVDDRFGGNRDLLPARRALHHRATAASGGRADDSASAAA